MLGPVTVLPFLIASFAVWIYSLKKSSILKYPRRFIIAIRYIGAVAIVLVAVTTFAEIISPTPRSPVDILLSRWGNTGFSTIHAFDKLKKLEPGSLKDYRIILKKAFGSALIRAAKRIAIIGDPDIDVPLLINALEKARKDPDQWYSDDIENALREMSKLELPENTPISIWRSRWLEKMEMPKDSP
jgi:hypothetical protein